MKTLGKSIAVMALGLLSFTNVSVAQSAGCDDNYIIYNDGLKTKDYPHAYKYYQKLVAENCEDVFKEKKTIFTNGAFLIKKELKAAEGDRKNVLLDSLFHAYESHTALLGEDLKIIEKYGLDFNKYKGKEDSQKAYDLLHKSIYGLVNNTKSSTAIQYYYKACLYQYKAQKLDKGQMVEEYLYLDEICNFKIAKYGETADTDPKAAKQVTSWTKTKSYIESIGSQFLTCEMLAEIYKPKLEADAADTVLSQKVLGLLNKKKCDGEFFEYVVVLVDGQNPSADSKFGIAVIKLKAGKKSEAAKYLDQAIEMQTDKAKRVEYIKWGVQISKMKYAKLWMKEEPSNGEPLLIKASLVGGSVNNKDVGDAIVKRKLVYSLAIDICEKAKSMDSSVSSRASKMISSYKELLPECGELFQHGISKGDSYKVPYWGETTSVKCK